MGSLDGSDEDGDGSSLVLFATIEVELSLQTMATQSLFKMVILLLTVLLNIMERLPSWGKVKSLRF